MSRLMIFEWIRQSFFILNPCGGFGCVTDFWSKSWPASRWIFSGGLFKPRKRSAGRDKTDKNKKLTTSDCHFYLKKEIFQCVLGKFWVQIFLPKSSSIEIRIDDSKGVWDVQDS